MVWHELQKLYEREVLLTESDPYLNNIQMGPKRLDQEIQKL